MDNPEIQATQGHKSQN